MLRVLKITAPFIVGVIIGIGILVWIFDDSFDRILDVVTSETEAEVNSGEEAGN